MLEIKGLSSIRRKVHRDPFLDASTKGLCVKQVPLLELWVSFPTIPVLGSGGSRDSIICLGKKVKPTVK